MKVNTPHFNTIIDELLTEGKKKTHPTKQSKDNGKSGKQFKKIAKSAGKKHDSKKAK